MMKEVFERFDEEFKAWVKHGYSPNAWSVEAFLKKEIIGARLDEQVNHWSDLDSCYKKERIKQLKEELKGGG